MYNLQRFYCIALVAVLERLKNKPSLPLDMVVSIAYNVGPAGACERRSSPATTRPPTRRRSFSTTRSSTTWASPRWSSW